MVTKVTRATALNPVATLREHLALKGEAATITSRSEALKKKIKDEENWLLNNEKRLLETELERQAREAEEKKI